MSDAKVGGGLMMEGASGELADKLEAESVSQPKSSRQCKAGL